MFKRVKEIIHPDRFFNESELTKDLDGKDFLTVLKMFKKRIEGWYVRPSFGMCIKEFKNKGDFLIIISCCTILDLLSQYYYVLKKSKGVNFQEFARNYIPECRNLLDHMKKLRYYDSKRMICVDDYIGNIRPTAPKDNAWILWFAYRNGIVHNGMVLGFAGHNRENRSVLFDIKEWSPRSDYIFIIINPILLLSRIKKVLDNYIEDVKKNPDLEKNFQNKFYRDFGYKII